MNLHPQDQIELESRNVNDTGLRDQIAALRQLMEATTQASSPASWLHEAGDIPSPASPHENGGVEGTRTAQTSISPSLPRPVGNPGERDDEAEARSCRQSQAGAVPARSHHCIGLCDPERHGPFETELDWYYAEGRASHAPNA